MRMQARPQAATFLLALALLLAVIATGAATWRAVSAEQAERLRQARFQFSVGDVRNSLSASLQLGLHLANLPNAQNQLDMEFKQHADVLSMDVADAAGQIVFSTDASGVGAHIPAVLLAECAAKGETQSHGEYADSQWRCAPLLDGIAQVAGVVVLRYTTRTTEGGRSESLLMWPWLALACALACAGAAWTAKAFGQLDARLREQRDVARSLVGSAAVSAHQPTPQMATPAEFATNSALKTSLGGAALAQLHATLTLAESEIEAMDDADVG